MIKIHILCIPKSFFFIYIWYELLPSIFISEIAIWNTEADSVLWIMRLAYSFAWSDSHVLLASAYIWYELLGSRTKSHNPFDGLAFSYSVHFGTTGRTGTFCCRPTIFHGDRFWILYFSFCSAFYTVSCCHNKKSYPLHHFALIPDISKTEKKTIIRYL